MCLSAASLTISKKRLANAREDTVGDGRSLKTLEQETVVVLGTKHLGELVLL
jgi:hypothetical protein